MRFCVRVLMAVVFAVTSNFAGAEEKEQAPAKPSASQKQEIKIEAAQLIILIKSTIIALQQANQTGNYSVLRDLGTPIFREHFDQARLASVFADLRNRRVNLYPVLFLAPDLSKPPEITQGGQLHLTGYFATRPVQIQFDILFTTLDGVWRLDGAAIDAIPEKPAAGLPVAPFSAESQSSVTTDAVKSVAAIGKTGKKFSKSSD